jgi:hypothetical protein
VPSGRHPAGGTGGRRCGRVAPVPLDLLGDRSGLAEQAVGVVATVGPGAARVARVAVSAGSPRPSPRRHRDGLVLDGQGLAPLALGAAKLLPPSSRTAGDSFWVTQTRTVHTATAAAYGVITVVEPDDVRIQLAAGRLLQRIHLAATGHGIALQHMNQVTERIDREATTGARATFAPRFAALLPSGAAPLLTFRVGYPVRAARPTPRRSVAEAAR